ncbi:hypothetical protein FRC11_000570, partial [Ceratobasidium sp. 423]
MPQPRRPLGLMSGSEGRLTPNNRGSCHSSLRLPAPKSRLVCLHRLRLTPSLSSNFRRASHRDEFQNRLYELVLRYFLVATEDEREMMRPIITAIDMDTDTWLGTSRHVDAQDSRMILSTYINNLSCNNDTQCDSRGPFLMLRLVLPSGHAYTQDLFPDIIRLTMEYAWSSIEGHGSNSKVVSFIQGTFNCLFLLLEPTHNNPYRLKLSCLTRIVDIMHENDILGLAARTIILLRPYESKPSPEC